MAFSMPKFLATLGLARQWPRILAATSSLIVATFFVLIYHGYSTSHIYLDKHPLVYNLKGSDLVHSKIFFGQLDSCGENPCLAHVNFDDTHWKSIKIPEPINYKINIGQKNDPGPIAMGMRIWLNIPEPLLKSPHTISFAPLYIEGKNIRLYLSGQLVYEAEGSSVRESNTIITIPRKYIEKGRVLIAITATLDQHINPILHRYKLYLGPKEEIEYLHRATMNFGVNYHMLATFSKGSVFIIFALIFLYTRASPGFPFFLIYALGATIEHPIIGNNGILTSEIQVPLYFQIKTAMTGALLQYFCLYFNHIKWRKICFVLWVAIHPLMFIISLLSQRDFPLFKVTNLIILSNAVYIGVFIFAIYQGIRYVKFLSERKVEAHFLRATKQFAAFISVYTALITYQTLFITYEGDELRLFLDLTFFFYIALTNARATGLNEGKILTLEGHYEEKLRMQRELNEAALIARALLPTAPPNWPFCHIDLFHKSITESSGDWYAFESSEDGQLFHLILCDITGHGVQAAIIVSTCKTVLSNMKADIPQITSDPNFVLLFARRLATTLFNHGDGHHTATFLGLTFDPKNGKIYYANGGHPPPFIIDTKENQIRIKQLVSRGNPLGFRADAQDLNLKEALLDINQILILSTDGIPLATNLKAFKAFLNEKCAHLNSFDNQENQNASLKKSFENPINKMHQPFAQELYDKIWEEHQRRTGIKPDDDVSIIIMTFYPNIETETLKEKHA